MRHNKAWYKPGRTVHVSDKMQRNYKYVITARYGRDFAEDFKPELSPKQMLDLGVFEGKYMNDCIDEFPLEWFNKAKVSHIADPSINLFKIKSRLSLQEWRKRHWIPIIKGDNDIRGWFQWYCRYYIGRRSHTDEIQIKRWRAFVRHQAQVVKSCARLKLTKKDILDGKNRPRQRQALLQWAYNPFVGAV